MSKKTAANDVIATWRERVDALQRELAFARSDKTAMREARDLVMEQRDAARTSAAEAERALAAVCNAAPISDADLDRLIALLGPYGAFAASPHRTFGGPPSTQLMRDVCSAIEGELRRRGVLPFTPVAAPASMPETDK